MRSTEPLYSELDFTLGEQYTYAVTPYTQPTIVYEQVCRDFDFPLDIQPHPWNRLSSGELLDQMQQFHWNEITTEDRLNPDYIYIHWYKLVEDCIGFDEYKQLLASGFGC